MLNSWAVPSGEACSEPVQTRHLCNLCPEAVSADELTSCYQREFVVQQCERWSPKMHSRFCAADQARALLLVLVGRRLAAAGLICIELWINHILPRVVTQPTTPLESEHFHINGQLEFSAILFVPRHSTAARSGQFLFHGQQCIRHESLVLPDYLDLIRAVVDFKEMPKELSLIDDRLLLEQNKSIRVVRKILTKRSIQLLQQLALSEASSAFWAEYSSVFKRALLQDSANRSKLAKLPLFGSSHCLQLISFDDYCSRMPNAQQGIVCANKPENRTAVLHSSPEVLFIADAADWEAVRVTAAGYGISLVGLQDWDKPVYGPELEPGWRAGMRRIMQAQSIYKQPDKSV